MARQIKRSYWAFVSYQPRDVILAGMVAAHVSCAISPVHDSDVWGPEDLYNRVRSVPKGSSVIMAGDIRVPCERIKIESIGSAIALDIPGKGLQELPELLSVKKPHTHVLLHYPSACLSETALESLRGYLDVSYVEPVGSPAAYYRYLSHQDNPDKAQYDSAEIIHIGDISASLGELATDSWEASRSLMEYICSLPQADRCFAGVVDYMCAQGRWEEVKEMRAHPYFYKSLL